MPCKSYKIFWGVSYKVEAKVESRFRLGLCFWNNWDLTILTTVILDSCKPTETHHVFFWPLLKIQRNSGLIVLLFFSKNSLPGPPKKSTKTSQQNLFGCFSPLKTLPPSTRFRCFRPWPPLLVALPEWQREGPGRLWKVPFDTSKMMVFFDRKTSQKLGTPTLFESSSKTYIFERNLFWSNP